MKFMFDSFEDYLSNSPLAGQKGPQVDTMKLIFSLARSSENLSEAEVARLLGISVKEFVLETTYRMAKTPAMGSSASKKISKTKVSKKNHELVLVSNGDDWEVLYLDGKKSECGA